MTTSSQKVEQAGNQPLETYQIVGRVLGPTIFALMFALDQSQDIMSTEAWRAAAVGLWMATWWATEAIPVPVTALLPLVIFDPLGILSIRDAAAPYANPTIYLYLGGFIMALTLERWNLHRRIALAIVSKTGTDGRRLIGGFMFVCAILSMWMTNTSTTMMLLPIVLSVSVVIRDNVPDLSDKTRSNFQIAMLLGLAYSASIGGLATLIGTPPNALLMGFMAENYGIEISFARWMLVGIPVSFVMLPIAWIGLTRFIFPCDIPPSEAVKTHLSELRVALGPMSTAEKRVAVVFAGLIFSWMFRKTITEAFGISGINDTGIVLTAALLLFLLPSGNATNPRLAVWEDMARLPWGVLVLFGGGLSLAAAVSGSGLAQWLGEQLAPLSAWGYRGPCGRGSNSGDLPHRAHQQSRDDCDTTACNGGDRNSSRFAAYRTDRADNNRRELCIHVAGGDATERHRVFDRQNQHSANGQSRYISESHRHRHRFAGLHVHRAGAA